VVKDFFVKIALYLRPKRGPYRIYKGPKMEGDRSFTGSPGPNKKVTWKEPIEQAVSI